jgi:hypothetical protein
MDPHDLTPLIDHIRNGLEPAAHWLRIDSTDLTVDETVDRIINS